MSESSELSDKSSSLFGLIPFIKFLNSSPGEEIKNLIKGIKPKRDDDLTSDSSDDSNNQKETVNKGPLPSFTKDQDFPLPN